MNSIIEAQMEFDEQVLKLRLDELRRLKIGKRKKLTRVNLLNRALSYS